MARRWHCLHRPADWVRALSLQTSGDKTDVNNPISKSVWSAEAGISSHLSSCGSFMLVFHTGSLEKAPHAALAADSLLIQVINTFDHTCLQKGNISAQVWFLQWVGCDCFSTICSKGLMSFLRGIMVSSFRIFMSCWDFFFFLVDGSFYNLWFCNIKSYKTIFFSWGGVHMLFFDTVRVYWGSASVKMCVLLAWLS